MKVYIGCPIWSFKGWVGNFYPEGTKSTQYLYEYARRLTTIEGNTTFYAVPAAKTVESWAEQTPESFRFCAKIPKAISHEGQLADHIERAREFVNVLRPLGPRLGPMLLQLPPRYSPRLQADLAQFLGEFPKDVRLAVEVRHLDWFDSPHREGLNELLSSHNVARVVIDTRPIRDLAGDKILEGSTYENLLAARERKPDVPVFLDRTTDFIFLRFIGHPDLAHNGQWIDEWVDYLVPELQAGASAFLICHAPASLTEPYICREFYSRLSARIDLPPLPWDEIEPNVPEQPSLF